MPEHRESPTLYRIPIIISDDLPLPFDTISRLYLLDTDEIMIPIISPPRPSFRAIIRRGMLKRYNRLPKKKKAFNLIVLTELKI